MPRRWHPGPRGPGPRARLARSWCRPGTNAGPADSVGAPARPDHPATLDHVSDADAALLRSLSAPPALHEAREARDYWHARARSLPRRRLVARREAIAMARRWDARLDAAARRALLTAPGPALRALVDVRRARLARGLRRAATLGMGAMFAAGATAALALDAAWHLIASLV